MTFGIRSIGRVGPAIHGTDSGIGWVKAYDPEAHDGRGFVELTNDAKEALRFESFEQAFNEWKRVPLRRPVREDGRPNRPLTAFTVEILQIPEEMSTQT